MAFKAKRKVEKKKKKMLRSDDGRTARKQKLTSVFHLSTRPRVTIARVRARNEGDRSEVENYVGVFIDYGLTGPRVPAGIARLQCTAAERNGGKGERERERARTRVLTADEGADLRFEIRARNKHEKIITIKTAVSVRDARAAARTRFSIGQSDLEHTRARK